MDNQYGSPTFSVKKFDPSKDNRLEGPYFNTAGWEQDFGGVHPVEMLARIAKFENKEEAKFEAYKKPFNRRGNSDFNKIIVCTYDAKIEAFGNGKQEKQARLVAARNMICKLKQINIGIVNETIAAGVKTSINPHKKPLVQQFKMFKSAGTLKSSFVPASSSISSELLNSSQKEADKKEIEQFQAYIEGRISDPSEKLPSADLITNTNKTKVATTPKIVFKRSSSEPAEAESDHLVKKKKTEDQDNQVIKDFTETGDGWNNEHYGYGNTNHGYYRRGGTGRGNYSNRGSWGGGGFKYGYGYGSWS